MHWYFQLSSLVFILSPALPSSPLMPCDCYLGLWLGANGPGCRWAETFRSLHQGEMPKLWRVPGRLPRWHRGASSPGCRKRWKCLGYGGISCGCPTPSEGAVVSGSDSYSPFHSFSWVRCKPTANPPEFAVGFWWPELIYPFLMMSPAEGLRALAVFFCKVPVPSPGPHYT